MIAAQTAVDTAQANLQSAQIKLATLGRATLQELQSARMAYSSAQAGLQTAQVKLDALLSGPTQADLETARSGLASAQATLSTRSGNIRASDIALQQEAVRQAEISLQQAQVDLDGNTLVAPFDGIVASVAGNVGESSSAGTATGTQSSGSSGFITLVDPREVRVDVTVDETDVAKIAVGKSATVTFDALANRIFRGTVVAISPSGALSQGVVTYPVSISIDTRNQVVVPAGLTASATITIDEKNDTLLVPNRAIRRQGREQVVDVMGVDGKPATRTVRTGVQNDQFTEIVEGVQEGEQVVIPSTTTRAPMVGGPGGGVPKPGGPTFVTKGG
jgi:multidrug resistance efflux pump